MNDNEAAIRRDQLLHGQRATMTLKGKRSPRKKFHTGEQPKGHEAFLKALEESGAMVRVVLISSGEEIHGRVHASDKFTISVQVDETDEGTRVLFKHDISEFSAAKRPTTATVGQA